MANLTSSLITCPGYRSLHHPGVKFHRSLTPDFPSAVFKRSAESAPDTSTKFAVFGGRGVVQFTVTNLAEALRQRE